MNVNGIKKFSNKCVIIGFDDFKYLGFDFNNLMDGTLSFANSKKFFEKLYHHPKISVIITNKDVYNDCKISEVNNGKSFVLVEDPHEFFFKFHNYLYTNTEFYKFDIEHKIGTRSKISQRAIISKTNTQIGENVIIEDNVIILDNVIIGDNVIIRAGSIIGSNGFQFIKGEKEPVYIKHAGGTFIDNNVEIQYNCTIDKHIFCDFTSVGEYSKFDNFVYFAHGSKIGKNSFIAAGSVVSGSTTIGDNVWIGPGSTLSTGLLIGNNSSISLGSVVTKDVHPNARVSGNFAIDHMKFLRHIKNINN